jgi:hypothetical protein
MRPSGSLEYGRTSHRCRQCYRRVVLPATLLTVVVYGLSYRSIRQSHTKYWFDKEAERRVPYTLFDAYSCGEFCVYVIFWPACAVERAITGRMFEYDKW